MQKLAADDAVSIHSSDYDPLTLCVTIFDRGQKSERIKTYTKNAKQPPTIELLTVTGLGAIESN